MAINASRRTGRLRIFPLEPGIKSKMRSPCSKLRTRRRLRRVNELLNKKSSAEVQQEINTQARPILIDRSVSSICASR